MRDRFWLQTLLAAVLLLLGGALLAFSAEVKVDVDKKSGSTQTVTVVLNDVTHTVSLGDLKEGEARTFGEGDDAVTVTRKGDRLLVTTKDDEEPEGGQRIIIVRDEDGKRLEKSMQMKVERVGRGADRVAARCRRHEKRLRFSHEASERLRQRLEKLKQRLSTLDLKEGKVPQDVLEELESLQLPELPGFDDDVFLVRPHAHVWVSGDDDDEDARVMVLGLPSHHRHGARGLWWVSEDDNAVRFRCDKDDVTLRVPEAEAKGKTFKCPICGAAMKELKPVREHSKVIVKKRVLEKEKQRKLEDKKEDK